MLRLPPFTYHRPRTLDEAFDVLGTNAGRVLPVAGGTDLIPNMKHRLFMPDHLVALSGLPELRGITVRNGELVIGAAETLDIVSRDARVRSHAPSLAQAAGLVAGPQLRNRGTVGGNLCLDTRCTYYNQTWFWRQALGFCLKKDGEVCHVTKVGKKCVAAHSADTPPVLMTLNASVDLAAPGGGVRTVAIRDLFVADGIWNTVRRPDEVLTRVRLPLSPGTRASFRKLRQRNAIDFPLLNVAVAVRLDGEVVASIEMVVSALGARPRVLTGLDDIAIGERLDVELMDELAERAHQQCHPLTNIIVDAEWRHAMVRVYARRALEDLILPEAAAA